MTVKNRQIYFSSALFDIFEILSIYGSGLCPFMKLTSIVIFLLRYTSRGLGFSTNPEIICAYAAGNKIEFPSTLKRKSFETNPDSEKYIGSVMFNGIVRHFF